MRPGFHTERHATMLDATRYSVLFEPVRIGPVMARNRFYQVPHCNGLGHLRPRGPRPPCER